MAYTTLKESLSKGSSESTANKYLEFIKDYSTGSWKDLYKGSPVKEGDRIEMTNGDYYIFTDNRWQVGLRKENYTRDYKENYTRDYVDNLCADYQKELAAKDKEIEELQKALTTLIGVKNGEST